MNKDRSLISILNSIPIHGFISQYRFDCIQSETLGGSSNAFKMGPKISAPFLGVLFVLMNQELNLLCKNGLKQ